MRGVGTWHSFRSDGRALFGDLIGLKRAGKKVWTYHSLFVKKRSQQFSRRGETFFLQSVGSISPFRRCFFPLSPAKFYVGGKRTDVARGHFGRRIEENDIFSVLLLLRRRRRLRLRRYLGSESLGEREEESNGRQDDRRRKNIRQIGRIKGRNFTNLRLRPSVCPSPN